MSVEAIQSKPGGLDDARKMVEGVAGVFSALRALSVQDPEVESLCQVGAALTQNLSNELDTAVESAPRHLRSVPVMGSFGAADSLEGEG